MASYNKVVLMGRLVARHEREENGRVRAAVEVTRRWYDADKAPREEVTRVQLEAFNGEADALAKFAVGRPVLVDGRLRMSEWETSAGERRSVLYVNVESVRGVSA